MNQNSRLEQLIMPTLEDLGYEMVRVQMQGSQRPTLQIMAERKDGSPMTVEDCATLSRALSAVLDVEDPIGGAYLLEVSSPGIDRPLTRPKDFANWAGFEARVETDMPVNGAKRFKGILKGLDELGRVTLTTDAGEVTIPLTQVSRAKLVLTDELIKAVTTETSEE